MMIKRVVSVFIMAPDKNQVAVFHRCGTMPTFASHWAPCSGSIETNEQPRDTALRELQEETNITSQVAATGLAPRHGLYLDVNSTDDSVIRVYPFLMQLPDTFEQLGLRGTEHDTFQWIRVQELNSLQPIVPGLVDAFHRATFGVHLMDQLPPSVQAWAHDRQSGAMTMAANAVRLCRNDPTVNVDTVAMLRPTMVAISNALRRLQSCSHNDVLQQIETATHEAVEMALQAVRRHMTGTANRRPDAAVLRVAVFSRSSTLCQLVQRLALEVPLHVTCSRSTPGQEGEQMARDVHDFVQSVRVVDDTELVHQLGGTVPAIDVVLVGADSVTAHDVVNKVGTLALARGAVAVSCPILCCADAFKVWDDTFPPPLEDIFEIIPRHMFTEVCLPNPS